METDCYFPAGVPLSQAGNAARQAEEAGFDAVWLTETRHNPFLASAAALAVTKGMRVGTGIAVAFPRSPMVTAQAAWDLTELGRGRFVLGLGTQPGYSSRAYSPSRRTSAPSAWSSRWDSGHAHRDAEGWAVPPRRPAPAPGPRAAPAGLTSRVWLVCLCCGTRPRLPRQEERASVLLIWNGQHNCAWRHISEEA